MDEPWKIYYDELYDRGAHIPEQEFNREDDMREAVHEAYQATADRLAIQLDFPEDEALALTRAFGRTAQRWIEEGDLDFDDLQDRLELTQAGWEQEHALG